jgi:anti-sigma factor ChrR (cupin superfamily)
MDELINADFTQRVVIQTADLPWLPSPQAGVERRMLDRIGAEVARATSLVRYAPQSRFPAHAHALGEEFLVLDGVFGDEHGDYPTGTYVRNPPGSRHTPRTTPGCVILVKLRQMAADETERLVIDTTVPDWQRGDPGGLQQRPLYASEREIVTLERLAQGARLAEIDCPGGEEIYLLSGTLIDDLGVYPAGTWMRNPPGHRRKLGAREGSVYWVKRGHLNCA